MSRIHSRLALAVSTAAIAALALSGCSSSDPISGGSETSAAPASDTIVIGSQAYYSNEIIAEIYAQALEAEGYEVDRQFRIGQRLNGWAEVVEGLQGGETVISAGWQKVVPGREVRSVPRGQGT